MTIESQLETLEKRTRMYGRTMCFLLVAFVALLTTAARSDHAGRFGDFLEANSVKVIDGSGNVVLELGRRKGAPGVLRGYSKPKSVPNFVFTFEDGKGLVKLNSQETGNPLVMMTQNPKNKGGAIVALDEANKAKVIVGADEEGGNIFVENKAEYSVVSFGASSYPKSKINRVSGPPGPQGHRESQCKEPPRDLGWYSQPRRSRQRRK